MTDNIAHNLRCLRNEFNLTRKQLADKIEISEDTIFSIEKQHNEARLETIRKISVYFSVTIDDLCNKRLRYEFI